MLSKYQDKEEESRAHSTRSESTHPGAPPRASCTTSAPGTGRGADAPGASQVGHESGTVVAVGGRGPRPRLRVRYGYLKTRSELVGPCNAATISFQEAASLRPVAPLRVRRPAVYALP